MWTAFSLLGVRALFPFKMFFPHVPVLVISTGTGVLLLSWYWRCYEYGDVPRTLYVDISVSWHAAFTPQVLLLPHFLAPAAPAPLRKGGVMPVRRFRSLAWSGGGAGYCISKSAECKLLAWNGVCRLLCEDLLRVECAGYWLRTERIARKIPGVSKLVATIPGSLCSAWC